MATAHLAHFFRPFQSPAAEPEPAAEEPDGGAGGVGPLGGAAPGRRRKPRDEPGARPGTGTWIEPEAPEPETKPEAPRKRLTVITEDPDAELRRLIAAKRKTEAQQRRLAELLNALDDIDAKATEIEERYDEEAALLLLLLE